MLIGERGNTMNTFNKIITLKITFILLIMIISISSTTLGAFNHNINQPLENINTTFYDQGEYEGRLRIYVIEPESRWDDYNDDPYHFAFLDFVFDEDLSIGYLQSFETSIYWDKAWAELSYIEENNIMVIAVAFNPDPKTGYSDPPQNNNMFDAYYVDAAAAATPGKPGNNTVTEEFTHTVFIEKGTATWCRYCPAMSNALYSIYESGDYPFYFVSLVEDKQDEAHNRLDIDYNILGYPTGFFDGGYKVVMGGNPDEEPYRTSIEASGQRDVHELDIEISVEYIGDPTLLLHVNVTNNEFLENRPPHKPETPEGEVLGAAGEDYSYSVVTSDPDMHDVFYWFDWGNGNSSGWLGPFNSSETCEAWYSWPEKGDYQIKVKAKDTYGDESAWSDPLGVVMPKSNLFSKTGFFSFLERFPMLAKLFSAVI